MTVRILYFASLRRAVGGIREETVRVAEGTTIAGLLAEAIVRHPEIQPFLPSLLIARNQEWTPRDTPLAEGDEIALMPPVSGG